MSINNIVKFRNAQSAIQAGEKDKALELLQEIAQENPEDARLWLQMVYAAATKKEAKEYLQEAIDRNASQLAVGQMDSWIEDFFEEEAIEETHQQNPGIFEKIRSMLEGSPKLVALVYLAILAQAESRTIVGDPRWGLALHGICLIMLLVHASMFSNRNERPFLLSLSLAPLIRLLSLTLPLPAFTLINWYAIIGAILLVAAYFLGQLIGVTRKKIGLIVGKVKVQLPIALSGIVLGYIEYIILRPEPLVSDFRFDQIILPALILLVFTGFLEELIFRGFFQYFAIRHLGRVGIFYVSFVFAVLHLGYRSIPDFIFVFIAALYFSYLVHKTGSIFGVTLAHGLTNIGLFLIYPFILTAPIG